MAPSGNSRHVNEERRKIPVDPLAFPPAFWPRKAVSLRPSPIGIGACVRAGPFPHHHPVVGGSPDPPTRPIAGLRGWTDRQQ